MACQCSIPLEGPAALARARIGPRDKLDPRRCGLGASAASEGRPRQARQDSINLFTRPHRTPLGTAARKEERTQCTLNGSQATRHPCLKTTCARIGSCWNFFLRRQPDGHALITQRAPDGTATCTAGLMAAVTPDDP